MFSHIVITGGAGFVGSNLALFLRSQYEDVKITCLDNLKRRGSELNLPRLKENKIHFVHGDIRNPSDLIECSPFDLLIECSAEPSVLAGINSSPRYLLDTNLMGTINCLEEVRKNNANILFLSTSRVYPIEQINTQKFHEEHTRFVLDSSGEGISEAGISELFPLKGARSLYGTTKLASELFIEEYQQAYGIKAIINRCGLLTGPWQMGKVDQGVIMLWVASHIYERKLSYIGYGGIGKQVRDMLHIDDLCRLIMIQIQNFDTYSGRIFNVGGGFVNSVSLLELTEICKDITGKSIQIDSIPETRPNDLIWYITDHALISSINGWKPEKSVPETVKEIADWIYNNKKKIENIF